MKRAIHLLTVIFLTFISISPSVATSVVTKSWKDAKAGKAISIPGWQYLILSTIARIAPRPIVRKAGINVRRKQR